MEIIQGGRRSGKTYRIAQMLKANPDAVMLTFSASERERVVKLYRLDPTRVRVFDRNALTGARYDRLYIDNLDLCLLMLLGTYPDAVSVSV